jgi:polysaccharide biosynthesis protein PslG
VTAIAVVLPFLRPPKVVIAEKANIDPDPTTIGVADSEIWFRSPADVNRSLDAVTATNATTVRIGIPWAGVEQVEGQLNWTDADKLVNAAVSRNMAILVAINSTPAWSVAPNNPPIMSPPASMASFADFCAKVAARYKGKYLLTRSGTNRMAFNSGGPPLTRRLTPRCSRRFIPE